MDEDFFKRLDESALHRIDKTIDTKYSLFDDIKFNDKSYRTIDHKISIYDGFRNNIDPKIIGSKENLCITSRSNNSIKNRESRNI